MEALIGHTPGRNIRYIRLKKAQGLLQSYELSITVIAFDCGFRDPSYLRKNMAKLWWNGEMKQTSNRLI
ncbi:MAG: helix-turn-helix domain-containing protein [Saprospiraceae bacterium]|nr:helix-turn-helix domain-containing protein [Saprospiraceae bacterium]